MRIVRLVLPVALLFGMASSAAAQSVVFVVRHAERADAAAGGNAMMAADPELSPAGRVASFFKVRCMRSWRPFCCGLAGSVSSERMFRWVHQEWIRKMMNRSNIMMEKEGTRKMRSGSRLPRKPD